MKSQIPNPKFQKANNLLREAKRSGGFTILESVVAITILSLTISGVFAAVQTSLSQSIIAKDEVRAFYLAQEAFEAIRNKRDANQLIGVKTNNPNHHWLAGIAEKAGDPCFPFLSICKVDANIMPPNQSFSFCPPSGCPNLKQNPATNIYNYSVGNDTNFNREIKIESVNANEIAVTVKITWTKGLLTKTFKAKTHFFNWI